MPPTPLMTAEFLAVDTETNGLPRERCELTEVGCVLVGGGELHDRWSSLVGVSAPLSRGIQRFTGITQGMVDAAPPAEAVLPELASRMAGRVLVAHNATFDVGVLRGAFARAGLDWPAPPVLCTVSLARRFAPLQRRRGLRPLAEALGIDVATSHRALPDAETCARVFCALFKKLCANAATVEEAVALLGPRRGSGRRRRPARMEERFARRPPERRPDVSALTTGPGVYVFRDADGRPLYVGKSIQVRTRVRQHFTAGASWLLRAESVDCQETESELGALLLEQRLIRALNPPANVRGTRPQDGYVYLRCRLDIAFPILEVAPEPAAGHAVCVGPVRGRAAAVELVEQLNSLFGLRHCGRALPRRAWPSAYGQMGRCLSPCLRDLDPNLYRERLDAALGLFSGGDGGRALLGHVERQMREASAARQYERAASLQRRHARLQTLVGRLGGVLRAVHAGSRLVIAPHPEQPGRGDALWIAGGRVVDWARLPDARGEVAERTAEAVRQTPAPALGGWLVPDELAEVRMVGAWLAGNEARVLALDPPPGPRRLERFVDAALGVSARARRPAAGPGHPTPGPTADRAGGARAGARGGA